jgi:hypothetical protein
MIGQTIPANYGITVCPDTAPRLICASSSCELPALDGSAEQAEARYAHGVTRCLTAARLASS